MFQKLCQIIGRLLQHGEDPLGSLGICHFCKYLRGYGLIAGLLKLIPECSIAVLCVPAELLLQFFREIDLSYAFYRRFLTHPDALRQEYVILTPFLRLRLPLHDLFYFCIVAACDHICLLPAIYP